MAVSPDGRDIASASKDGTVRVWDAASPPRPRTLQSPSVLTYGGDVECLAFSPDGRRLVSGHDDNALRVWELPSGRPLHVIKGHTQRIKCVVVQPRRPHHRLRQHGPHGAAVGRRHRPAPDHLHRTHRRDPGGLVFTPDGQTVLSGGVDRTIQAWDPATGVVRYVLRGHSEADSRPGAEPRRPHPRFGQPRQDVHPLGSPRRSAPRDTPGTYRRINAVAFSPDGRTLATSSDDRTVRLWDAADGSPRGILEGHIDEVDGLAFSPDGRLASSSRDKTIRLWDPASGQTLLILKGHAGAHPLHQVQPRRPDSRLGQL